MSNNCKTPRCSYQKGGYGSNGYPSNSYNSYNGYRDSYTNYDDNYERQGGYVDYDYERNGYGCYGGGGYQSNQISDKGLVLALLVGGALITYILYRAITDNLAAAGGRKTWTFKTDFLNNILTGKIKQFDQCSYRFLNYFYRRVHIYPCSTYMNGLGMSCMIKENHLSNVNSSLDMGRI